MKVDEIKEVILPFIEEPIVSFEIHKCIFEQNNGSKLYNDIIRSNVKSAFGIYIWVNKMNGQIIYIGMAGRVKQNGSLSIHSLQNRLLASRGKDKNTNKDIPTNAHVKCVMTNNNIDSFDFFIMYSKKNEPPAYIEALLLYNFFKKNNSLPILNRSF
jgi:hypothetical protein